MLNIENEILTPNEVARFLRISKQTLIKMLKRGDLPGIQVTQRKDWKIKKQDVLDYIGEK